MRDTLGTRAVEYRILLALGEPCGLIVSVPATGECVFRLRRDWDDFAGDEAPVLSALAADLESKQREMGTTGFLRWIDETLSNTLRVESPRPAIARSLAPAAQALYRRHVRSTVRAYDTHLPLIPIDLAAGGLGADHSAARAEGAEEWIDAYLPRRPQLTGDLFVVRVHGHSMEPDIPDGALGLFRAYQGGSRQGGIYIVQRVATLDDGGEFTLKRYYSTRCAGSSTDHEDASWHHDQIEMRPDNPDFRSWPLAPEQDRWITVAQFLEVLEEPLEELD